MEQLKSYLDGELDLAQQAEVETHLRNDEELQKMVNDFKSISETMKTAQAGEPYGYDELTEKLARDGRSKVEANKKVWRLASFWSLGAAALVIAGGVLSKGGFNASGADAGVHSESTVFADKSVASTSSPKAAEAMPQQDFAKKSEESPAGGGFGGNMKGARSNLSDDAESRQKFGAVKNMAGAAAQAPSDGEVSGKTSAIRGGDAMSPKAPDTQWYEKSGDREDLFKSNVRAIKDKTAVTTTTIGDTPQGIYVERKGEIQLKVEDLNKSIDEATGMAQNFGGFVSGTQMSNRADGGEASMTLRVPTKNYSAVMTKLRNMGEVVTENSGSQDITTETVDHGSRMISWADEEKRLMDELAKAKTNQDKYRIRRHLEDARANLDSERAVVKSLKDRAEYSTINIGFLRGENAEKAGAGSGNWSGSAFKDAKSGLGTVGQVFGTLLIYLGVFSPVWLPFVIAAFVIKRRS